MVYIFLDISKHY